MWTIPRTNLEKAKARGAVLAEKGGVQEFGEGLRGSMGFSPEGGVKEDIKTIGSGLKEEAAHPIESASLLLTGCLMRSKRSSTRLTRSSTARI